MAKNPIVVGIKKTYLLSLCALTFLSMASGILLLIGMLPTITVWQYDRTYNKNICVTVGFMNLAGIVPFIVAVFPFGLHMQQAMPILQSTKTWGLIYLSALIGWMILQGLHPLIKNHLTTQINRREEKFKKMQEELVEKWGADVAKLKEQ
jgi:hypothetical protein